MAFLPEIASFEESLITAYDLSTGTSSFVSSDISGYLQFSLQFTGSSVAGSNSFVLEQSNNGSNWSELADSFELPIGNSTFVIDKQFFSGKQLRINFLTAGSGTLDCVLIAKR